MENDTPTERELTEQQKDFCRQFLVDFNAARAAKAAGYAPSTIRSYIYADLMQNSAVKAEIQRLIKERAARTLISADRVVLELAAVAFSNFSNYVVDDSGQLLLTEGVDPIAHQAVASVRRKVRRLGRAPDAIEETDVEIRLWDKPAALKMLMLHLGMIEKKMLVQGDAEKPIKIEAKHEHTAAQMPADDTILECLKRLGMVIPDPE